jgi:nucleoside-diphosphate-sugar epimerase
MRILITGVSGFLGTHLAADLLAAGHDVAGLVRPGSRMAPGLTTIPLWQIADGGAGLRQALQTFAPDVVVHLAALYIAEHKPEDIVSLVRANIEYGACLLDAMSEAGCDAMVYAGTSWQHYRDLDYCPVNLYAATKQAFSSLSDYYRDAAGLRLLELHLYDSYGEDDPRKKLINLLKFYAQSAEILDMSEGNQRMHLVHVDDLSRGFALACEQVRAFGVGERRVYRLPSAAAISVRELVELFNVQNPERQVNVRWGARPFRAREVFQPWEGAAVLPGWQPTVSIAEGVRRLCRPATMGQASALSVGNR